MYSFVIQIAIEVNGAVVLVAIIGTLGFIDVKVLDVIADPVKIWRIIKSILFLFIFFKNFLYNNHCQF